LDIEDWRIKIDALDERLVDLLNQRSICCIEIGRIKQERGLPVYSPDREAQVLDNVENRNGGPLESDAVRRLFERIIDESRRLERITIEREAESNNTAARTAAVPQRGAGQNRANKAGRRKVR